MTESQRITEILESMYQEMSDMNVAIDSIVDTLQLTLVNSPGHFQYSRLDHIAAQIYELQEYQKNNVDQLQRLRKE